MEAFEVNVTAHSNRDLTSQEFERQVELIKPHMAWDQGSWAWRTRLNGSDGERVARVLNALFEAARVYRTTVTVELVPAEQAEGQAAASA
ncbi:hypothetical protein [Nonomuraea sp. NPDC005650]|uniref:hypothetical protein n=1 Tax=Nonomuraea sp. NPDC005650 TaxID=3157045 RepID=UPI0033A392A5